MAMILSVVAVAEAHADNAIVEMPALQVPFDDLGQQGVIVVRIPATGQYVTNDAERAVTRFFPASTFKVANTLIALETGAVGSVDEVIPFGGRLQPVKAWEQDMSLRDALPISNVAIFQTVARRVGADAYQVWLDGLGYGSAEVGQDVTRFWLRGPLAISAVEQVTFLDALAQGSLEASAQSQASTREIMRVEARGDRALYAKSGWTTAPNPDIGWYVGWVEAPDFKAPFALNIDTRSRADLPLREQLSKEVLAALELYK
ncbi:class D beta-lactamase [Shimia ponticola]|uniref:class D beta-lactamase n=1 Tax=Shimia ponticola TaxID=2582893 RepID=UPI00164C81A8|nr:class D beta-lactamase [Shimia ponticola]